MKTTSRLLNKLIREMAWDPKSQPELAHYNGIGDDDRANGLLSREENDKEKQIIRDYHRLHAEEISKFYKEIVKQDGMITCMHSPGYEGAYSQSKLASIGPIEWIQRYGIRGNDQLSTCMFPYKITDFYKISDDDLGMNSEEVFWDHSLILGGFPTMMSYNDMWTQTLSQLHPDLVRFQKQSGTTKTAGKMPNITVFNDFILDNKISEETVLDNWFVKGIHAVSSDENQIRDIEKRLIKDCTTNKIPLYISFVEQQTTKRIV